MKMRSIFLVGLSIIIFAGCAYNEGIIQKDDISYLKLTGNLLDISLQIDDGEIIPLINNPEDNTIYEIKPGIHIIKVFRGNKLLVKRKLYFDNQITKEVNVK